MIHRWRLYALVFGVGLTLLADRALTSVLQARATVTIIATGLVNPRGLNFGPDGALYVAEAGSGGSGPCIDGSDGLHKCYGATGGVRKILLGNPGTTFPRVLDQLPSIAPVGMDGNLATGPHDVAFQGLGNGYVTIGLGADPGKRQDPSFAQVGSKFGRLIRFQPNGKWSFQEDLSLFEQLANPDDDPTNPLDGALDSNPYGILPQPGRVLFTDAGGNSLNAVAANGSISNLAAFFNRAGAPGTPGLQAVPTTVATGPDGALYVGQLTGGPFPGGGARVYRVPSNGGTPTIYNATFPGFTKIIDIAFGKDGSLYVLEISAPAGGPPFKSPGALFRIPPGGGTPVDVTPTVPGGFVAPGGIAIGSDEALYITVNSISAKDGFVIKVGQ
jgi:hypothetical protein